MPPPLEEAKASISSKKMIEGAADLARRNKSATAFSDAPTYLLNNSGPFTAKKFIPDSVATAFAFFFVFCFEKKNVKKNDKKKREKLKIYMISTLYNKFIFTVKKN